MNLKDIKDAARKAFRDQQTQDTEGGVPDGISFIAGFVEGARHLQNAYETLNAHDEMLIATVDKLKEDNRKLVEALKFYADKNKANSIFNYDYQDEEDCDFHEDTQLTHFGKLARQVLKEIGEE